MSADIVKRVPDLKEVLGAMIFAANRALTVREMRNCLIEVAQAEGEYTKSFDGVKDGDIRNALAELAGELESRHNGFVLSEISGGYRLQSEESCGIWLKYLLNMRKASRLSQPSLETLAIIACRQPISRADIEGIRGVSIDHVIKSLMELQLVRIVGRSELPGRPFLFGTTQIFLEHFGLKDIGSLGDLTGVKLQARHASTAEASMDVAIEAAVERGGVPAGTQGEKAESAAIAEGAAATATPETSSETMSEGATGEPGEGAETHEPQ